MFDDPKKELKKLEQQLLEDEEWFQRELDSAKRMIGQAPARQRPTAPQTPQAPKPAAQAKPSRSAGSDRKEPKSQTTPAKKPAKTPAKAPVKAPEKAPEKKQRNTGLVILACLESLGILGLVAYWVLVLLK